MKTRFLMPAVFVVLAACNGSSETKPPTNDSQTQDDGYVQGQIDLMNFMIDLSEAIDSTTGMLTENVTIEGPDGEKIKEFLTKVPYCRCEEPIHATGEAHVHQGKLRFRETLGSPLLGMMTLYNKKGMPPAPGLPCRMLFWNPKQLNFSDCQHMSDEKGDPAYDQLCFGKLPLAIRLRPSGTGSHHSGHGSPCHPN